MSNGTLQQLASKGVQDSHLSISPETSFFKRVYKRVSNYAIESIDQSIPSLAWDKEFTTQLSRNGDLMSELWLVMDVNRAVLNAPGNDSVYFTNSLGHACLRYASLEVGNNEIDRTTGMHMEMKWEVESDVNRNVNELVLRGNSAQELINWTSSGNTLDKDGNAVVQLYIKLPFYFSKSRSQALPVIALQYHDIRVKFHLRALSELLVYTNGSNTTLDSTNNGTIRSGHLMANFVYLDSMERRLFASNAHEYLIKNIQVSDFHTKAASGTRVSAQVVFNHPVTVVYWVVQKQSNVTALDYFNFERTAGRGDDTIQTAVIKFNGSERERARGPLYWRAVTSSEYFNRTPRRNMYMYSFAQYPLSWWPSGSANLSRIDNTTLEFTFPATDADGGAYGAADVTVIAENFNVRSGKIGDIFRRCNQYTRNPKQRRWSKQRLC